MIASRSNKQKRTFTTARDALNALHTAQAITEAEAQAAKEATEALPALQDAVAELKEGADAKMRDMDALPEVSAQQEIDRIRAELTNLHGIIAEDGQHQECPHCSGAVTIVEGVILVYAGEDHDKLVKLARVSLVEAEERMRAAGEHMVNIKGQMTALNRERMDMQRPLDDAKSALAVAQNAAAKTGTVITEAHRANLAKCEQEVEDAKRVVQMVAAQIQAQRHHESVLRYAEIVPGYRPPGCTPDHDGSWAAPA